MKLEITSEYETKTPIEMANAIVADDGGTATDAWIECGTDLRYSYTDGDGDECEDEIPLSDIPDLTEYRACIGAVDEDGEEIIVCIGY